MPFLVLGLGLLMAASGLSFMAIGWPVIQVERGWSMVIAGATMLAGGLVTSALGLVLRAIERLQFKAIPTVGTTDEVAPAILAEPTLSMGSEIPPVAPEPEKIEAHVEPPAPIATDLVADEAELKERPPHPVRRMPGPKVFDVPPPPPVESPSNGAEPVEAAVTKDEIELSPPIDDWLDHAQDNAGVHHDDPIDAPTQPDIPPQPAPEPEPVSPTVAVVGRYEADGTSYVMYADGSIEAQSPAGVYRFSSMAELKAFIES